MKRVLRRGLRFALVGLVNTSIGLLAIYAMMYFVGAGVATANFIGYGLGLGVSFLLNRLWTFESRAPMGRLLPGYLAVVALAYVANLAVVLAGTRYAHVGSYAVQLLGVLCYSTLMFLGCHFLVFRKGTPM
ncbi:MAG TPA: GtrA family protein [Acidobacteriaceae bacterium]|nr:GtrA family protein [Acidobacteriaceae bacterium]